MTGEDRDEEPESPVETERPFDTDPACDVDRVRMPKDTDWVEDDNVRLGMAACSLLTLFDPC